MARQIETPLCKYGETTALWGLTFLKSPVDFDILWQAFTGMPSILIFRLPLVLGDDTVLLNVDALDASWLHANHFEISLALTVYNSNYVFVVFLCVLNSKERQVKIRYPVRWEFIANKGMMKKRKNSLAITTDARQIIDIENI